MSAQQTAAGQNRAMPVQSFGSDFTDRRRSTQPVSLERRRTIQQAEPEKIIVSVIAKTRISWAPGFEQYLPLESVIGVGLGYAALTRDGEPVFEEHGQDFDQLMTVAEADKLAREDPRHDWKIHLVALLEDRHYRRDSEGRWALCRRGYGLS